MMIMEIKCLFIFTVFFVALSTCITIDNQLMQAKTKKDCYERVALGERLSPSDTVRRVDTSSFEKCETECTLDKDRCNSFSFGISAKGNGTCELSVREIQSLDTLDDSISDPDFDIFAKRFNCPDGALKDPLVATSRPDLDPYEGSGQGQYGSKPSNEGSNYGSSSRPNTPYENSRPTRPSNSYNNNRPDPDDRRPSYGNDRPNNYDQNRKPSYGNDRPNNYDQNRRPSYGNDRPNNYDQNRRPSYGNDRPNNYDQNSKPSYETDSRPSYNNDRDGYNAKPTYGNDQRPSYNEQSYGPSRPPPGWIPPTKLSDRPYTIERDRPYYGSSAGTSSFSYGSSSSSFSSSNYAGSTHYNEPLYPSRPSYYDEKDPNRYYLYTDHNNSDDYNNWNRPSNQYNPYNLYGERFPYKEYEYNNLQRPNRDPSRPLPDIYEEKIPFKDQGYSDYPYRPNDLYDPRPNYYRPNIYGNGYDDYRPNNYYEKPIGPVRPLYENGLNSYYGRPMDPMRPLYDYNDRPYRRPNKDQYGNEIAQIYGQEIAVSHGSAYGSNDVSGGGYYQKPSKPIDGYRGNGYDNLSPNYYYEKNKFDKYNSGGGKYQNNDNDVYPQNKPSDYRPSYNNDRPDPPSGSSSYGITSQSDYDSSYKRYDVYGSRYDNYRPSGSYDDKYMNKNEPSSYGDDRPSKIPYDKDRPYGKPEDRPNSGYGQNRPYDNKDRPDPDRPYGKPEDSRPNSGYGQQNRPYDKDRPDPDRSYGKPVDSRPNSGYGQQNRPYDKDRPDPDRPYGKPEDTRPNSGYGQQNRPYDLDAGYGKPQKRPYDDSGYNSNNRPIYDNNRPDPDRSDSGYGKPSNRPYDDNRPNYDSNRPDADYGGRPSADYGNDRYRPCGPYQNNLYRYPDNRGVYYGGNFYRYGSNNSDRPDPAYGDRNRYDSDRNTGYGGGPVGPPKEPDTYGQEYRRKGK